MLNMLLVVLVAAFRQFIIMKYVISLLISLVRFVQMLVLSLLFNLLIVNLCSMYATANQEDGAWLDVASSPGLLGSELVVCVF